MQTGEIIAYAAKAKAAGSIRSCMGAGWREVCDNRSFDRVIEMVKDFNALTMVVGCFMEMPTEALENNLPATGICASAYNSNTSANHCRDGINSSYHNNWQQTPDNVRRRALVLAGI